MQTTSKQKKEEKSKILLDKCKHEVILLAKENTMNTTKDKERKNRLQFISLLVASIDIDNPTPKKKAQRLANALSALAYEEKLLAIGE